MAKQIKVSSAVSLFKEDGHDLKGLYQLFFNSVKSDVMNRMQPWGEHTVYETAPYGVFVDSYTMLKAADCATKEIENALADFTPDAALGEKRILKFNEDYKNLKELSGKIQPYGFWKILFRANKQLRKLLEEKEEIENMMISLVDLLHVAFYKFTQVRGTKKQFVDGFNRYLNA